MARWIGVKLTKETVWEWLLERVVVAPNGCYIWIGSSSGDDGRGCNYPKMKLPNSRKTAYVTRVIWTLVFGPIPKQKQLDHKCKHWGDQTVPPLAYRRCVNPFHLEPVTQSDNLKRNHLAQHLGVLDV